MTHQGPELGRSLQEGCRVPPHTTLPRTPLLSCSSFKLQPGRALHRQRAPSPVPNSPRWASGPLLLSPSTPAAYTVSHQHATMPRPLGTRQVLRGKLRLGGRLDG